MPPRLDALDGFINAVEVSDRLKAACKGNFRQSHARLGRDQVLRVVDAVLVDEFLEVLRQMRVEATRDIMTFVAELTRHSFERDVLPVMLRDVKEHSVQHQAAFRLTLRIGEGNGVEEGGGGYGRVFGFFV